MQFKLSIKNYLKLILIYSVVLRTDYTVAELAATRNTQDIINDSQNGILKPMQPQAKHGASSQQIEFNKVLKENKSKQSKYTKFNKNSPGYKDYQIYDPQYNKQWYLGSEHFGAARVDAAHHYGFGSPDIIVAVIDSAVDPYHPDLRDRIWRNSGEIGKDKFGKDKASNGIDDDSNNYVDDSEGYDFFNGTATNLNYLYSTHGTHVAGIIAASRNSNGILGVSPGVRIMNLGVFSNAPDHDATGLLSIKSQKKLKNKNLRDTENSRKTKNILDVKTKNISTFSGHDIYKLSQIDAKEYFKQNKFSTGVQNGEAVYTAQAIMYAADNNAKIINLSLGGSNFSEQEYIAILYAQRKGLLVIAAAGNNSLNLEFKREYPASYPLDNLISVGAVDSFGKITDFSNYGNESVDVFAPGRDIYSTIPNGGYESLSGTSMAAPVVAGIAALVWSQDLNQSYAQVRDRIFESAAPNPIFKMAAYTSGIVNANLAVTPKQSLKSYKVHTDNFLSSSGKIEKNISCTLCGTRFLCGDIKQSLDTELESGNSSKQSIASICYARSRVYIAKEEANIINEQDQLHYRLRGEVYGISRSKLNSIKMLTEGFKLSDLIQSVGQERIEVLMNNNLLVPILNKNDFAKQSQESFKAFSKNLNAKAEDISLLQDYSFYRYADAILNSPIAYLENKKGIYYFNKNIDPKKLTQIKLTLAQYIGDESKLVSLKLPKELIEQLSKSQSLLQALVQKQIDEKRMPGSEVDDFVQKLLANPNLELAGDIVAEQLKSAGTLVNAPEENTPVANEAEQAHSGSKGIVDTVKVDESGYANLDGDTNTQNNMASGNINVGSTNSNTFSAANTNAPAKQTTEPEASKLQPVATQMPLTNISKPIETNTNTSMISGKPTKPNEMLINNFEKTELIPFLNFSSSKKQSISSDPMGKELQKASAASLALENRLSTIEARIGFNEYAKDKNLANERVSAFQNRVLLSNKNSDKIAKKYKLEKNSDQVLKPAGKAKASKEKNEEIKFLANVSRYSRYTASYELLGSAKQTKEVKNETINKVNAPAPSLIYANMNETNLVAQSATEIIVSNKVDTKKIRDQGKVEILSAMTGKTSDEKMYTRKNETKKPASVVVSDSKKLSLVEQFNLKCNSNLLDNKSPIDIMTELMSKSSDTEMNKLACSEMPKSILPTNITNNPCDNIIQDSVDYSDINTCKTDNYMETKKQELEWFATETDNHRMDYVSGTASSPDLIGRMTNLMNIAKMCAANKQAIGDANANKHKYPFNHADIAVEMLKLQCIEIYKTTIPAENCAGDSHTTHWLLNECLENIDNDLSWNRNRVDGYFRFPNDIRKLIDKIVGKKEYLVCNKFNAIFDPTNQGISPSLKLTNEQQKVYDYILQNKKNMNIKKPIKIEKQGCESMKYLIDRLHSPIAPIKHDKETLKLLKYRITKAKDYLASTKICKESKKTKICSYDPIGLESNLRGRQEILDALKSKTSR